MGWAFILPAFAHLLVFALIPIGYAFYVSLYKLQLFKPGMRFVGFENFSYALTEPAFQNALLNTLKFTLLSVPGGIALSLAVAILVNQKLMGMTLFRTIFYIPAISSGIALSMIWIYVYLPDIGLINSILMGLGFKDSIDFLNRTEWAMPALAFMTMWTGLGPRMVLYIAGLVAIPPSLYEAASIDGAVGWRAFSKITWPMLTPTTLFVVVTSTISAMQVFTPVYLMTKGGPEDSTDVVGYHIYTEAWVNFNTGLASSKSFILLVIVAIISAIQFRMAKDKMSLGGSA